MPNIANIQKAIDDAAKSTVTQYGIPAIAAVLVNNNGKDVLHSVQGVKDATKSATAASNKVTKSDYFNIGSISKPITGLFIAALIKKGILTWDTKISDVFTEFKSKTFRDHCGLNENFLNTKVYELISHTSGMGGTYFFTDGTKGGDSDPFRFPEDQGLKNGGSTRDAEWKSFEALRYQRYLYALLYMKKKKYKYNQVLDTGYNNTHADGYSSAVTIVTAMAERKMNRAWELIMTELLFDPLPMGIIFGPIPNGMQHHYYDGSKYVPDGSFTNALFAYSSKFMTGGMSCTVEGMAQYIKYNFRALNYSQAFDVVAYQKPVAYAAQGGLLVGGSGNNISAGHMGGTTGSLSTVNLYPHLGYGFSVIVSCSGGNAEPALNSLYSKLEDIKKNWNSY